MIRTNRLNIKQYTQKDFNDFAAIVMNDEIMKNIRGKGHDLDITTQKFNEALSTNESNELMGFYNVTKKASNQLVGFAKLTPTDSNELEVGYALLKKCWGKGYASEITKSLIEHAKKHFPKNDIVAIVNVGNVTSSHVLKKQHFFLEKTETLKNVLVEYYKLLK